MWEGSQGHKYVEHAKESGLVHTQDGATSHSTRMSTERRKMIDPATFNLTVL